MSWTQTQIATATTNPFGVAQIACNASALPAATAFSGSPSSAQYTGTSSCADSRSATPYTLSFGNGAVAGGGLTQTSQVKSLPANGTGKDNAFTIVQTNASVTMAGSTACYVSLQTTILRVGK
jgi:hypothetical protein